MTCGNTPLKTLSTPLSTQAGAMLIGMEISSEAIEPWSGDLLGQIQQRQTYAYIAHERAALAAICGDYAAWMMYPPTPHDDPADYEPYWARLTDVVEDQDEREAIVAEWFDRNRL